MELFLDILLRGLLTVAAVILFTRLNGLRSFSKMSSFDFSLTVAFGSILGGMLLSPSGDWEMGVFAIAILFGIQAILAWARIRSESIASAVDNPPLLLMRQGQVFDAALSRGRVTRADLIAKLREANVLKMSDVHAVVMESTGDISVLHGNEEMDNVDLDEMLNGVIVPN